jgi:alkanesulfonate monooxygenase SsuD/methylene tetrahydromethanopterin reductase-like flavin-dependent oxidoreductase (luciferase family)
MPARVVGMIGVTPPSSKASLHVIEGGLSPAYLAEFAVALRNTSCLVGTPEQVAEAILKYYRLGIDSFLIRGFDPLNDAVEFGRELIPRIKAGTAAIDRIKAAE